MNTNLLPLIQKPLKHLQTSISFTSVPFATSVLFQTDTLYLRATHSMDLLKGIISILLLGKKPLLRYQLHFPQLLTCPGRTNPKVFKFCLLFAVILESVILQILLKLFSPPEFILLHLSSDAEFQAVLRNPSPASLSYQITQHSSTVCHLLHPLFISFMKFMGNPNYSSHNLPIHSAASSFISSYN